MDPAGAAVVHIICMYCQKKSSDVDPISVRTLMCSICASTMLTANIHRITQGQSPYYWHSRSSGRAAGRRCGYCVPVENHLWTLGRIIMILACAMVVSCTRWIDWKCYAWKAESIVFKSETHPNSLPSCRRTREDRSCKQRWSIALKPNEKKQVIM